MMGYLLVQKIFTIIINLNKIQIAFESVLERDLYMFALENAGENSLEFTDDCALIENMGGEVLVVKGSEENIKLTTPVDVILAESILKNRLKNGNC